MAVQRNRDGVRAVRQARPQRDAGEAGRDGNEATDGDADLQRAQLPGRGFCHPTTVQSEASRFSIII